MPPGWKRCAFCERENEWEKLHVICGRVCPPHGSLLTSSGSATVRHGFSLPQFMLLFITLWDTRTYTLTPERQSTFTISHFIYSFIFFSEYRFYFLIHTTVITAVEDRTLVSQPVKLFSHLSLSSSSCLLSLFQSFVLPISTVFLALGPSQHLPVSLLRAKYEQLQFFVFSVLRSKSWPMLLCKAR